MSANMQDGRLPSALYADLFYSNPGAAEFRQDHLEVWIQVYLSGSESELVSAHSIVSSFEAAYPGCKVEPEVLEHVINTLTHNARLTEEAGRYRLTPSARAVVDSAQRRYTRSRRSLFDRILTKIEETTRTALSTHESAEIERCTERLLIAALLDERRSLEQLYADPDDFSGLANRAQDRQQELAVCLREAFDGALSTRLLEFRRSILISIAECEQDEKAYLHTLHRSVIGSFFLIQDPHHIENIRQVIRGREYFIDTNVYLAWLYKSQSAHRIVKPTLDVLRSAGVKFYILPETAAEITRIEADARKAALRALQDPNVAAFLLRKRKAISADFLAARAVDSNLSFDLWAKLFAGTERMLPLLGIEQRPIEFDSGETFEGDAPTFRNAIKGQKEDAGHFPHDEAIEHDVFALLKIAKLQLRGSRDAWGSKTRFLSLDSALNPALREVRNALNRRYEHVDLPFALARIILPTSAHELTREQYEDYVVSSVQQDLGLIVEMRGYSDVYFIDKLAKAGLPVKTLLEAPAEMVEPVLAELQGRSGLSRKLDQALTTVDAATRHALVSELGREIADSIAFRSELQDETERKLIEEQAARGRLATELATLSEQFNELSTRLNTHQGATEKFLVQIKTAEEMEAELEATNRRLQQQNRRMAAVSVTAVIVASVGILLAILL